jgi:hypothetical protein
MIYFVFPGAFPLSLIYQETSTATRYVFTYFLLFFKERLMAVLGITENRLFLAYAMNCDDVFARIPGVGFMRAMKFMKEHDSFKLEYLKEAFGTVASEQVLKDVRRQISKLWNLLRKGAPSILEKLPRDSDSSTIQEFLEEVDEHDEPVRSILNARWNTRNVSKNQVPPVYLERTREEKNAAHKAETKRTIASQRSTFFSLNMFNVLLHDKSAEEFGFAEQYKIYLILLK